MAQVLSIQAIFSFSNLCDIPKISIIKDEKEKKGQ